MWTPTEITGALGSGLSYTLDEGRVGVAQTKGTLTNREFIIALSLAVHNEYITKRALKILVALERLFSLPIIIF